MLADTRQNQTGAPTTGGLDEQGLHNLNAAYWNLGAPQLVEHAVQRREGALAADGSLVVRTGQFTGRSPKDKFIVRDESTDSHVQWGAVNQPMTEEQFDKLYTRATAFWQGQDAYVQDLLVGADPQYGMPVRVVTQLAWHNLFGRQLFIRPGTTDHRTPDFTIVFAPEFQANPAAEGTNSETCIVINFKKRVVLICGTSYAGEMKKSAFTIMNYLLPARGVFPMHCSANVGPAGDVALFFGLSGTGKTTLSADPSRSLIGDDEHGWSDHGVFNFEGGCYA
jgi:phosphoenolpyruvate carboxykinase (ATP)